MAQLLSSDAGTSTANLHAALAMTSNPEPSGPEGEAPALSANQRDSGCSGSSQPSPAPEQHPDCLSQCARTSSEPPQAAEGQASAAKDPRAALFEARRVAIAECFRQGVELEAEQYAHASLFSTTPCMLKYDTG